MHNLTKKQHELLEYIRSATSEAGYAPSYREIMRGLDYKSVSTVATHVNSLIAKGRLVKRGHSARSLEVVDGESATTLPPRDAAETAIRDKLEQLYAEEPHDDAAIDALQKSLIVLGYESPTQLS